MTLYNASTLQGRRLASVACLQVNTTLHNHVIGACPACVPGEATVRYDLLLDTRCSTEIGLMGTFCSLVDNVKGSKAYL